MSSQVAVYLRVSTLDQEKGIASQQHAIQSYLDGHGLKAKWYRDRISGAKDKRPGLDALERDVFNGRIKTVIVWKLDRLTRRGPRDGLNLIGKWRDSGVRLVSVTEQFDFSGAVGQMVASVLFSVAAMFREQLRENTKRGLAAAKAKGKKLGRRPTLHRSDVQPLLDEGLGVSQIARQLGRSRQSVYDALKR